MRSFSNRKGFTLVELLIVIVVIGVLSAMMMLSSTEAVSSAKASNIISNLRNIKTAVLAWYADNLDKVKITKAGNDTEYKIDGTTVPSDFIKNNKSEILKYLNNDSSITLTHKNDKNIKKGNYMLTAVGHSKYWYICYYVNGDTSIQGKLASRAKTAGLFGTDKFGTDQFDKKLTNYYTNQKYACMLVLNLAD